MTLEEIGETFDLNLREVIMVGDSWSDIEAARAAGSQPVLVRTGKGKKTLENHQEALVDVPVFDDLYQVSLALQPGFSVS